MPSRNFGIDPLHEGDTLAFENGKKYRISINADGSPRFVEVDPMPDIPGIYTTKVKGRNKGYLRLILGLDGKWHSLNLSELTIDDLPSPQRTAERAHRNKTLALVHRYDDALDVF
jgi:hypothetical protein